MDKILAVIKKIIPRKLFKLLQPAYHFGLAWLAAVVYGRPSEELIVVGITGTTGKTTSVYLAAKMLAHAGYKVGYTSTAFLSDGEKEWFNDKKMTMIGRFFTQKILRRMVKNGCQYAIIETSSQGVAQYRHRFINYDILVFTGLYPEHIEAHGSFDNYKKAKGRLFAHLKKCAPKYIDGEKKVKRTSGIGKTDLNRAKKTVIVNGNDEHAQYFLHFWAEKKMVYVDDDKRPDLSSSRFGEKVKIVNYGRVASGASGTSFQTGGVGINLKLPGAFNAANAMNAVCIGLVGGLSADEIRQGLESVAGVAGRLERIALGQDFHVLVDYAFEPEALAKLYETISSIPHRKVIHVLGSAGGGRDIARRPRLGKLAGEHADCVIVTNEDPYDDDPEIIIDQVALGAEKAGKKMDQNLFKIPDRRKGIGLALSKADSGDIVLITGKGCEQAICLANGEKMPWDDRQVAGELIKKMIRE